MLKGLLIKLYSFPLHLLKLMLCTLLNMMCSISFSATHVNAILIFASIHPIHHAFDSDFTMHALSPVYCTVGSLCSTHDYLDFMCAYKLCDSPLLIVFMMYNTSPLPVCVTCSTHYLNFYLCFISCISFMLF